MYLEIYPDIVFFLNFFIDLLLLYLLKLINRKGSTIWRLLGASAVGGLTAALISIFPWLNLRFNLEYHAALFRCLKAAWKLVTLLLMLFIAFGRLSRKDYMKQVITFMLITFFVGGFMNSVYYHTNLRLFLLPLKYSCLFSNVSFKFILIMLLCLILLGAIMVVLRRLYRHGLRELYKVELNYKGNRYTATGLYDTGNCLHDPIYQKPVIVIEESLLEQLLPVEELREFREILADMKKTEKEAAAGLSKQDLQSYFSYDIIRRLSFIPFRSIGSEGDIMPGIMLDGIIVNMGDELINCTKIVAAVSGQKLSSKEEYQVILNKELL